MKPLIKALIPGMRKYLRMNGCNLSPDYDWAFRFEYNDDEVVVDIDEDTVVNIYDEEGSGGFFHYLDGVILAAKEEHLKVVK